MMFLSEIENSLLDLLDRENIVIAMHDRDGKVFFCNEAVGKVFGYKLEEILGKNIKITIPERFHSRHDRRLVDLNNKSEKIDQFVSAANIKAGSGIALHKDEHEFGCWSWAVAYKNETTLIFVVFIASNERDREIIKSTFEIITSKYSHLDKSIIPLAFLENQIKRPAMHTK